MTKDIEIIVGPGGLIPEEDQGRVAVKALGRLKVGDFVEGIGRVMSTVDVPVVKTLDGDVVALDKKPLDYEVSVVRDFGSIK